ncbi:MAG: DUF3667 domain-containing protein [Rubrivivax sp.]
MPGPLPAAPQAHCLNCDQPLGLPRPRYCPQCGQDTRERVPRLWEFVRQFTGAYLSTEGALWRTLLALLRPGLLTTEYLAGRRRRYVLPVRLYLSASLLLLVALRLTVAMDVDPTQVSLDGQPRGALTIDLGSARVGVKDGRFYCEQLPPWLCRRLERRMDLDPRGLARELEYALPRFINQFGTALALLVPLFAAWSFVVHLGGGWRYAEHLVFALHVHVAWFALLLLALPGLPWLRAAALLAMPAYHLLAARRVYHRGWWGTLWRAAFVAAAYGVTLSLALAAVTVTTLIG